jgi:hypothetical protein
MARHAREEQSTRSSTQPFPRRATGPVRQNCPGFCRILGRLRLLRLSGISLDLASAAAVLSSGMKVTAQGYCRRHSTAWPSPLGVWL